jgi:D-glycero-D-manno-heptose 1,7-bisphosphate phosphatase
MEAKQKRGAKLMLSNISKDMIGASDRRLEAMVDKKLLIFDADGTLRRCTVRDQACPNRNGQWEIIPWARDALARVNWSLYRFGIVSNQGGVEGGFLSEETALRMLMDCALEVLPEEVHPHIQKGAIQLCPHLPKTGCWCRKPLPTLLNDMMQIYHAEPLSTVYVGDLDTDEQAAQAAGCGFQWAWDFCGKTAEDWTYYLAARHQAELGPAWVDSPDGNTMVMRMDRGACPRCKVGALRPQITTDGSAHFADRCDSCRALWWTQTPKAVPSRFLPLD